MRWVFVGLLVGAGLPAAGPPALAQQSASYRLEEAVFNAAGHPAGGDVPASAVYRVGLDSLGEGVVRAGLASPSFHMDASFAGAYPPPGPVGELSFRDRTTLRWAPEKSAGSYNLYRDLLSALSGGGYGECRQSGLPTTAATDAETPPAGNGWFYLVTVKNRLDEEGSKGTSSAGAERPNPHPCP